MLRATGELLHVGYMGVALQRNASLRLSVREPPGLDKSIAAQWFTRNSQKKFCFIVSCRSVVGIQDAFAGAKIRSDYALRSPLLQFRRGMAEQPAIDLLVVLTRCWYRADRPRSV